MDSQNDQIRRAVPTLPPAHLPADLAKLRDRYLQEFPEAAAGADLLAYVPVALRHLLSLRLELCRAQTLPARYLEIATAALQNRPIRGDAVDQLVARFAQALRDSGGMRTSALRRDLRRYFTDAQIVELTLMLSMAIAFETFEAVLTSV